MSKLITQLDSLSDFSLVRYEPGDIILLNKYTKKPYRYYQLNQQINILPDVVHPYLQRPVLQKNGALYPKGDSTLAVELETRLRAYEPLNYSTEQICNTFAPIIECIEYLHNNGIVHGNISAESILFFQNGDILLKDWIFKTQQKSLYNSSQLTKGDDLKALGMLIAQFACLQRQELLQALSLEQIISKALEKYQSSFCYGLIILLKGMYKKLGCVLSLMSNDQKYIKDDEVLSLFKKANSLKIERDREQLRKSQQKTLLAKKRKDQQIQKEKLNQQLPKKEPIGESNLSNISANTSMQGSPTKKFNITANKKVIKLDDSENKKSFNQDVKKKQIEKITKIIERSNAFVNQLMARKTNEKKMLQGSKMHNTFMYDSYGPESAGKKLYGKDSPKITSPKIASPSKRLRSISKKK